jgi:hypothetical protein
MKIVRTDMELEMPLVDNMLEEWGHELTLFPGGDAAAGRGDPSTMP